MGMSIAVTPEFDIQKDRNIPTIMNPSISLSKIQFEVNGNTHSEIKTRLPLRVSSSDENDTESYPLVEI